MTDDAEEAWNELFKEAIRRRLPMDPMNDKHRINYTVKLASGERFGQVDLLLNARSCFYFHVFWSQENVADYMRKKFAPKLLPVEYKLKRTGVRYVEPGYVKRAIESSLERYVKTIELLEEAK